MRNYVVTLFFALISSAAIADQLKQREQREITLAEQAVLSALVTANHRVGKYICSQNPVACLGPNGSELALALIASRNTKTSLSGLAAVVRYRMDAGLAEGYTCYVLSKGRKISRYLSELNPNILENTCRGELAQLGKTAGRLIDEVEPTMVCANAEQIKERVRSIIEAIASGRSCSPEDY